jgi:nitrite reductase/ring-hydroxylating ferredoxin subunit
LFFKKKTVWYKIFDSADIAAKQLPVNRLQLINIANKKICIAHTKEGFFAVADKCPHNGASLSRGQCTEENSVVCPVHRYHFDLKTGRAKSGIADVADTYPIQVKEEGVYIGLEEKSWNLFG